MMPILYTKSYSIRIEFHLVVRSEGPELCIHTVIVSVRPGTATSAQAFALLAEIFIIFVQGHGALFSELLILFRF